MRKQKRPTQSHGKEKAEKQVAAAKRRFVKALERTNSPRIAAQRAKIDLRTALTWKINDAEFSEAWDEAIEIAKDQLLASMHDDAVKPGGETELRIFLARHYFPEEFGDKSNVKPQLNTVEAIMTAFAEAMRDVFDSARPESQSEDYSVPGLVSKCVH